MEHCNIKQSQVFDCLAGSPVCISGQALSLGRLDLDVHIVCICIQEQLDTEWNHFFFVTFQIGSPMHRNITDLIYICRKN